LRQKTDKFLTFALLASIACLNILGLTQGTKDRNLHHFYLSKTEISAHNQGVQFEMPSALEEEVDDYESSHSENFHLSPFVITNLYIHSNYRPAFVYSKKPDAYTLYKRFGVFLI
jgi:hypothetical protein